MTRTLIAIGGAEAKVRRRTVLRAFVAAAGGPGCRIAVVPSASSLGPEVVEVYRTVFTALGAAEVVALRPTSRAEAADPALVAQLTEVDAVSRGGDGGVGVLRAPGQPGAHRATSEFDNTAGDPDFAPSANGSRRPVLIDQESRSEGRSVDLA